MADAFTKLSISHDTAQLMVAAAVAKARALGTAQAIAILDESGLLKAFCHMDGAPVVGIEVAQDKAFTALFGVPSGHFHTAVKDDPTLLGGLLRIPRIAIFGGGLPIRIGDRVVGGIGVSGGSVEEDVSSAQAGLDAVRTHHAQESVDSPEGHTSRVADPVR